MEKFEKTVKKIQGIEQDHAETISRLNADIEQLNEAVKNAESQRAESLKTGNQKLYNAALFELDRIKAERSEKTAELQRAAHDPYLTPGAAQALTADLLAVLKEEEKALEKKFVELVDSVFMELVEHEERIKTANNLIVKMNIDMMKDEKKKELFQRTGQRFYMTQYALNFPFLNSVNFVRSNPAYSENGGKYRIDHV